jgi:NADH-quinone oxidoreductase subunit M
MMQSTSSLLSLAIWCPIAFGIFVLAFGRDSNRGLVRGVSLLGSLTSFLVTLPLITNFDNSAHGMQFVENSPG